MANLRKVALAMFLLIGVLACGLTAAPASPTASLQASPTTGSSDTPDSTAIV
jgi:hypothetical protein